MKGNNCRIINYRTFAFGAIVMLSTIFLVAKCFDSLWYLFPLLVLFFGLGVYFYTKKSFGKLIYFLVVVLITVGVCFISIFSYNDFSVNGKLDTYTCRVDSIYSQYESSITVVASRVKSSKTLRGKLLLTLYGAEEIEIGDKLTFEGKLTSLDIKSLYKDDFKLYKNNIKYTARVSFSKTTRVNGSLTITENIKDITKSNLIGIMGEEVGGVAFALMFGDKSLIDSDIYGIFRASGTAHLLAISGLHISLLIGLLYWIISKLRVKNIYKFLIMLVFLSVYCFMCDFAVSVVRTSIMGLVLIGCKLLGRRYDSLNSLGLAGMIILLVSPLSIFDVGFLLSFLAVLSIILFAKTFDKLKIKNKFFKTTITTMLTTLIVTIMTYPITTSFFGEVAIYSVFANLIVIPLFSLGYIALFVANLFAYIGLKFLLYIPKGILGMVIIINNWFSALPLAVVRVAGLSLIIVLLIYLAIFIISRFVGVKIVTKVVSCFVIFVICGTILVSNSIINNNVCKVSFDCEYYSAVITSFGSKNYLVSPKISRSYNTKIKESLSKHNVAYLDGIIFAEGDNFETKLLQNFMKDFGSPIIYVPASHNAITNLKSSKIKYIEYDSGKSLDGNVYIKVKDLNHSKFTNIVVNGTHFGFISDDFDIKDLELLDFKINYFCSKYAVESEYIDNFVYKKTSINCR